jgi:hypothetical protein
MSLHLFVLPGLFWGPKQCFFLDFHSQTINGVRVLKNNVYFMKRPFQRAITRLKHRSYEKFATPES